MSNESKRMFEIIRSWYLTKKNLILITVLSRDTIDCLDRRGELPGHVHFIRCGRFVKVEYTGTVYVRLQSLRHTNPFELDLLRSMATSFAGEKVLHRLLAAYHHRFEWFGLESRFDAAIRDLCG
jgi:hypothetical protein